MPPGNRDKLSKIEDLKAKLFSRNFKTKIEHRDNYSQIDAEEVTDSWGNGEGPVKDANDRFFMRTSFFKKFFIFSTIFFCLAMLYGGYMFFVGGNTVSNANIDISILGNSFAEGGEELALQVSITNKNTTALELADLVIEYPKSSAGTLSEEVGRIRHTLGAIPSGAVRNENVKVILFGAQGAIRPIKFTLEYRVEGSNAIFIKEKTYEINISSTPINISVEAPTEVSPNQDINLKIKSTLNATRPASQILVKVDYPLGFQFISAVPPPSLGNNVWTLGDLAPGSEREISIVGRMIDVFDGEEKNFKIWTGTQSRTDKSDIDIVFNSAIHAFTIKRPFVEASFLMGGIKQREYAIDSKVEATGEIRWVNNLETAVNDLSVRAKISGNAVNRKSIRPQQGFYDSLSDTIIWDRNYIRGLEQVDPGASGSLFFSFLPNSLSSEAQGGLNNPSIVVDVSISGKQQLSGFEPKEIRNSESTTIRIISDVGFANKALYYSGPFTNSGPIPPKVEKETTYTIIWGLSNSSNNISRATVRSSLPAWVKFTGPISPPNENLSYNSSTRELTWNAGNIPKGAGITTSSREVAFRITLSPSLSQAGSAPNIVNEAVLTGHDDFAKVDIRINRPSLNTKLSNDPVFPIGGERVAE